MSHTVRFTENFTANLESVRQYFLAQDAQPLFERLLDWLFDTLVVNLEGFPRMGRDFLQLQPQSDEGKALLARLEKRMRKDMEIREYIAEDYLVLYAIRKSTVLLMSIRHHRQLSFDLRGHWL